MRAIKQCANVSCSLEPARAAMAAKRATSRCRGRVPSHSSRPLALLLEGSPARGSQSLERSIRATRCEPDAGVCRLAVAPPSADAET